MADIEIERGYDVLHNNRVRFGIRLTNKSDTAISEVQVLLDYSHSLFELEGSEIEKFAAIPPGKSRTAKFILKPLSCVHNEKIGATVIYKNSRWEKQNFEVRPKEIHYICPFLKEKQIGRSDFLKLLGSGHTVENNVNFKNLSIGQFIGFLSCTCKNRLYKVDEFPIENGKVLYLAGDSPGEKAYYLLTVTVRRIDNILQVVLKANSDKDFGIHGFLNEILDNLRHLVKSVSPAIEITTIKNEQVINITDSVLMYPNFSGKFKTEAVNIESSVVPLNDIGCFNDEGKEKDTEKKHHKEQYEKKQITNKKEETQSERTQTELFVKQEMYELHKQVKEENKDKAMRKYQKTPSLLDKNDKITLEYTESLLKDDFLPEKRDEIIENCIEAVQYKKEKEQQEKSREEERKRKEKEALERKQKEEAKQKQREDQEKVRRQKEEEAEQKQREEERKRKEKEALERKQLEEQKRKRKEKEEKARKKAEEKAIKEKEEQEILRQQQEEAEQKREEERKREALEGKKLEKPRDTQEIKKEVSVSSGKIHIKEKTANIFGLVLMVVLALVAAAYLGSYGDHAIPVPAIPVSLASFNANTTSGHAPLDVQFTTLSENATLVNWDFGDGNTSIERNPKHTYFTPGKYIVNLTASNGNITNSTLTTISVSAEPFAYILGDSVSVIDIATDKVVGIIDVPFNPEVVAATPDGSKIYMAKEGNISTGHDSDISVIDTATNTITSNVFVGSYPWGIAVTPDGTKVYLAVSNDYSNPFPNTVSVIDTATDTVVSRVNIGSQPCDVAVTPDGKKAYVTDWNNTVSVIDTSTNTITDTLNISSATDQDLFRVKISPDGKKAYLINECGDTVFVIDTATNTIIATVTAGRTLSGVVTPDGTKVYVASYEDDNVSVIDTSTNTVIATMNLGKGPYAIAVTPNGKKVYVANRYSNNVSVIDTATNRVTTTVSVGGEPCDVAIAPGGKKVYVPNYKDNTVSVIDTATDTVTTTVRVGQNPSASIIR